jgi:hypothetical protein
MRAILTRREARDARFAFSYAMNKMSAAAMGDPRGLTLAVAAFQGLE